MGIIQPRTENLGYVFFLAAVAALGGFLFGYDTAVVSGTITGVRTQFDLDTLQLGWYVGCALIGSIGGVVVAVKMSDWLGRKPVLLLSGVLFASSGFGCAIVSTVEELVFYRIVGGVGIGIASIISPLYISEISVARYRGRLVALYQLAITVGIVASYFANSYVLKYSQVLSFDSDWLQLIFVRESWRAMLGLEAVPAVFFFMILFFIPESPRWLTVNRRESKAFVIMERLVGGEAARVQLSEIKKVVSSESRSDWRLLFGPKYRVMLLVGICLAMLGQFTGVNAVFYYGPIIFEEAGLAQTGALDSQIIIGLVNVFSTVLAMWLIDRIGRKMLIYIGVSGMVFSLILIGFYFMLNKGGDQFPVIWLLALIVFYIFCCAISVCAVIFVLLSEMYPVKVRGTAMSLAGLSLWVGTYLVGQLTPWLLKTLSPSGVFWLFAGMCVPYLFITWRLVPDTTGKSLEEIEESLYAPSEVNRTERRFFRNRKKKGMRV